MSTEQAYVEGFVKRANEYGLTNNEAIELLQKSAFQIGSPSYRSVRETYDSLPNPFQYATPRGVSGHVAGTASRSATPPATPANPFQYATPRGVSGHASATRLPRPATAQISSAAGNAAAPAPAPSRNMFQRMYDTTGLGALDKGIQTADQNNRDLQGILKDTQESNKDYQKMNSSLAATINSTREGTENLRNMNMRMQGGPAVQTAAQPAPASQPVQTAVPSPAVTPQAAPSPAVTPQAAPSPAAAPQQQGPSNAYLAKVMGSYNPNSRLDQQKAQAIRAAYKPGMTANQIYSNPAYIAASRGGAGGGGSMLAQR